MSCQYKNLKPGDPYTFYEISISYCGVCGSYIPDEHHVQTSYLGHSDDQNGIISDTFKRYINGKCMFCGTDHIFIWVHCDGDGSGFSMELPLFIELPLEIDSETSIKTESKLS